MSVIKIIERLFYNEVMYSDRPLVLSFINETNEECRALLSLLESFSDENLGVKVCTIDINAEKAIAARFEIESTPTVIVFKNGKIKARAEGVPTKGEILKMLEVK